MTFEEALKRITSLVPTMCGEPDCNGCATNRVALDVLAKEGDARAAEMRERAARFLADLAEATFAATDPDQLEAVRALAGMILQLPLSPTDTPAACELCREWPCVCGPFGCPGCYAVGEPCAPGCIDAEIEAEHLHAIETGDYDRFDEDEDEDEDNAN